MGLCLFVLMGLLLVQSLFTNSVKQAIGVNGLFYVLAGFQVVILAGLYFGMKETKGLTTKQLLNLYKQTK